MINETALLTSPLLGPVARFIETISVVVGGIFGLYLILVIFKFIEYRRLRKMIKGMGAEISSLNKKLDNTRKHLLGIKTKKSPAKKVSAKKKR